MQIKLGYSLSFECPRPTPTLLALKLHPSRRADLLTPEILAFSPAVETSMGHEVDAHWGCHVGGRGPVRFPESGHLR